MDDIIYPDQAILKTSKYSFHMKLTKQRNRDTGIIERFIINIGGRYNKCVTISIPSNSTETSGIIASIEKKDGCAFDTEPPHPSRQPGFSQHLLLLGLSVARKLNPAVKRFYFDDCSHVNCEMPDKTIIPISLRNLHIAFHGTSWYEYYFDAKRQHNHEEYRKRVNNLYNPEKKPTIFDFKNPELNELLTPFYTASATWSEFFHTIEEKYKAKKCAVVYPWLMQSLYIIFDGNMFDDMKWYIDIEENAAKNKTPFVSFMSYHVRNQHGAGRHTRKRRSSRSSYTYPEYTSFIMNPGKVATYSYRRFLQ
jgi:hypothetical protein